MSRYRTYKNGIYGHRYKNNYIVKNTETKFFSVLDETGNTISDNLVDFNECEWYIDKRTATEQELEIIHHLYALELFKISALFGEMMEKKSRSGLDPDETELYKWVEKVRWRKSGDRPL